MVTEISEKIMLNIKYEHFSLDLLVRFKLKEKYTDIFCANMLYHSYPFCPFIETNIFFLSAVLFFTKISQVIQI